MQPKIGIQKGTWSSKRENEIPRSESKRELGRQNERMNPKIGIQKGTWSSKRVNAAQDWNPKGLFLEHIR